MSWFSDLFTGGVEDIVNAGGELVDRFIETPDEARAFKIELEKEVTSRMNAIESTTQQNLQARERILVAELQQGDSYTKRARPTVVYFGLLMIAVNYLIVPLVSLVSKGEVITFELPVEFWTAWGGIVATWAIGRSFEKRGINNSTVKAVTGTHKPTSILD